MSTELHVVRYRDGWDVIFDGARNAESHHPTREAAVMAGIARAKRDGAIFVTFDRDGNEIARHACALAGWLA